MGKHARARGDSGLGLGQGRVGVADRDDYTTRAKAPDRVQRSVQFRCERDQPEGSESQHEIERAAARLQIKRGVRSETGGRDERPLEMHPQNRSAWGARGARMMAAGLRGHRPCDRGVRAFDLRQRSGDCGRQKRAGALARQMAGQRRKLVRRRRHHLDPVRAVDLQVDEAGQDVIVTAGRRGLDGLDTLGETDAAGESAAVAGPRSLRSDVSSQAAAPALS